MIIKINILQVDEAEKGPHSEQKIWEGKKLKSAQYNFGSKDKEKRHKEKTKQYDLILDDEIDFIQALKMPGTVKDKDEKDDMTDYDKKRMSIEECKKSLPVFPFRQALLDVSSFKYYNYILFYFNLI